MPNRLNLLTGVLEINDIVFNVNIPFFASSSEPSGHSINCTLAKKATNDFPTLADALRFFQTTRPDNDLKVTTKAGDSFKMQLLSFEIDHINNRAEIRMTRGKLTDEAAVK